MKNPGSHRTPGPIQWAPAPSSGHPDSHAETSTSKAPALQLAEISAEAMGNSWNDSAKEMELVNLPKKTMENGETWTSCGFFHEEWDAYQKGNSSGYHQG